MFYTQLKTLDMGLRPLTKENIGFEAVNHY